MSTAILEFPLVSARAEFTERQEAVRKVSESGEMAEAPQQRKLLLYLAERALMGVGEAADEHYVATRVLGRPAGFDPTFDAGVRQLKRRLGQRLAAYYAGEGKRSRLRLVAGRGLCLRFERVNVMTGVAVVAPKGAAAGPGEMVHGLLVATLAEARWLRVCSVAGGSRGECEYFLEGELLETASGEWLWCLRLGDCETGVVMFSSVSTVRAQSLPADVGTGAARVLEHLQRLGAGE